MSRCALTGVIPWNSSAQPPKTKAARPAWSRADSTVRTRRRSLAIGLASPALERCALAVLVQDALAAADLKVRLSTAGLPEDERQESEEASAILRRARATAHHKLLPLTTLPKDAKP